MDPPHDTKPTIGTDFLGVGFAIAAVALGAYEWIHFTLITSPGTTKNQVYLPLTAAAWGVVALTLLGTALAAAQYGRRMPTQVFLVVTGFLAVTVGLDLTDLHWPGSPHACPTAAIAVGAVLMALVTLRSSREIIYAAVTLGGVLLFAFLTEPHDDPVALAPDIAMLALATVPPVTAAVAVHWFRRLTDVELDRVLAHSAVAVQHAGIGGTPSEALTHLDLAAEELLDGVASGRTPFPPSVETAKASAALARELRFHLVESRRETWLHGAIRESEFLSRNVTLVDADGLAGLLGPSQRDALLSAAWLLISDPYKYSPTVEIAFRHREMGSEDRLRLTTTVLVTIVARGVPRRRVDPAIWDAIARVGSYADSSHNKSVRVDIRCVVNNPAGA